MAMSMRAAPEGSRFFCSQLRRVLSPNNYAQAFSELQSGRKSSHWMWYVFPQLSGHSEIAQFYAIKRMDVPI
jgi:uncharacterized protein (DUF1810 family)